MMLLQTNHDIMVCKVKLEHYNKLIIVHCKNTNLIHLLFISVFSFFIIH